MFSLVSCASLRSAGRNSVAAVKNSTSATVRKSRRSPKCRSCRKCPISDIADLLPGQPGQSRGSPRKGLEGTAHRPRTRPGLPQRTQTAGSGSSAARSISRNPRCPNPAAKWTAACSRRGCRDRIPSNHVIPGLIPELRWESSRACPDCSASASPPSPSPRRWSLRAEEILPPGRTPRGQTYRQPVSRNAGTGPRRRHPAHAAARHRR